jgi:hypothetical protein
MSQAIPISNPKNNLPDSPVVSPGILGWLLPHWWSASTPSAVPSEGTGPDPSLFESVIEDNWEYVFDDKEKFEQLKYKLEKESRLRELEEIAKRKSVIKLSNEWRGFIRQFLESLPAIEYSFASNALDSSSRYSIIGEIVKQFQDSWLGKLEMPPVTIEFFRVFATICGQIIIQNIRGFLGLVRNLLISLSLQVL